jgi:hypothetical protein
VTFELATVVSVAAGAGISFGGLAAWVVRATMLNRIDSLEASRAGMGERFGTAVEKLEKWQYGHDCVERFKAGRYP